MKTTLLSDQNSIQVLREPYAHLVDNVALDQKIYDKLAAAFPTPQKFVKGLNTIGNNQAIRIPASDIIGNPEFSAEWQEFFRYHTSQEFWNDIVRVFGDAIRSTHPRLEEQAGMPLNDWRAKIRGTDAKGDVELDALFVVNTPVRKMSSVRPAHVDAENEIFAGLLYMRPGEDKIGGGDLSMYRFRSEPAYGGHYAPLSAVIEEKTIAYAANRYVAFVNSAHSIHGVTPRPPTDVYRRYINTVAVTPFKAFKLPAMPLFDQFKFWLQRRKTKSYGVRAKMN